jgi:serine phosphatase RsbU (regulator of sigma subunit)
LFVSLLVLIGYFLGHSYIVQLNIHKNKVISTLEAVSKTAAAQLDANQLDYLLDSYKKLDEIKTNNQDGVYELLHNQLVRIQELNNFNTSIYTLKLDKSKDSFFFGVNSSEKPFYMHKYSDYPEKLKQDYEIGGTMDVYEDKNGHWISAFAPIKNKDNQTISIVQVDARFDDFLEEARVEIFKNIGISLAFTFFVLFFLIRSIRSILLKEDQLTASLIQSKLELEQKGQETLDSILYAKKIQDAILPELPIIKSHLPESFIYYLPRDIVSGDFYWFKKTRDKIFIASVDCTGHGVPGAFMSMIGSILLDDIITKKQIDQPNEILKLLHDDIVKALKQAKKSKASRDGMDVALCVIDTSLNTLSFAGAFRPLILIRDNELTRIKSTSAPIGGIRDKEVDFDLHNIDVEKGDSFYIFSDGFPDQFSGETNKKYMTKRFRDFLLKISDHPMSNQKTLLEVEFKDWMGAADQVDDVLVIGFRL